MTDRSSLTTSRTKPRVSRRKLSAFVALLALLLIVATALITEVTVRLGIQNARRGTLQRSRRTSGQPLPGPFHTWLPDASRPLPCDAGCRLSVHRHHMANTLRVTAPTIGPVRLTAGQSCGYSAIRSPTDTALTTKIHFLGDCNGSCPPTKLLISVCQPIPPYSRASNCARPCAGRRPRAVVALYFAEHDGRNTMLRGRRQIFHFWNRLGELTPPYARLVDGELRIVTGEQLYRPFPLVKQSAAMNAIEQAYVEWEKRRGKSTDHLVTEAVIQQMAELCKSHDTAFLVAGFSPEPETTALLEFCRRHDVAADNIQYDWQDPDNSNWPADAWHPSPLGHQRMADNLECTLKLGLLVDDYRSRLADPAQRVQAHVDLGIAHRKQAGAKSRRPRET